MRIVKKKVCEICGCEISLSNYSKHLRRHSLHPETFKKRLHANRITMCCQFCGQHYDKMQSLTNHERFCKLNPCREISTLKLFYKSKPWQKGRKAWNKGLTKITDERVARGADSRKEFYKTHPGSFNGKKHSEETKKKLSEKAKKNNLGGCFYRGGGKVSGIKLDSSYEILLAEDLNLHNIRWERPKRFKYKDLSGKLHTYTPDFYLPDYDIYLDPKNDYLINNINPALGYRDVDKIKWVEEQNNIKILIVDKNNLSWKKLLKIINTAVA